MPVKKYSPVTPGTRFRIGNSFEEITTSKPEKSLLAPLKRTGGRNNQGRMTARYRGGGHKRRYRIMDPFSLAWKYYGAHHQNPTHIHPQPRPAAFRQ